MLDSCFLIRCLATEPPSTEQALLQRLVRAGSRLCVTKTILKEVDRWVANHVRDGDMALKWKSLSQQLSVLSTKQGDVIWEAGHILTHYPDNLHIAAAKLENSLLVSYDHAMIRTARDEGVAAYYPMELLTAC
ncbi:MAG: type II toxin-antitoxin system VapC family toxin [Nitrososphaerales archaeon]